MSENWESFIKALMTFFVTIVVPVCVWGVKYYDSRKVKFKENSLGAEAVKRIEEKLEDMDRVCCDTQKQLDVAREERAQLRNSFESLRDHLQKEYAKMIDYMLESKK